MKKILCMGSITMDMTMRVPHFPEPGETVKTDNFIQMPGGKGSNQAVAAAKLGGAVTYFTKLGGDANSDLLTHKMQAFNINMDEVIYDSSLCAGVAMVQVHMETGENICTFYPGSCLELTGQDVRDNSHIFDKCDILLITMECMADTVYEAIHLAKEKGKIVILDPAPIPTDGIPQEIARLVDYVKPNETEAAALTGMPVDSVEEALLALEKLRLSGFTCPIISLGSRGCVAFIDTGGVHFDAYPVRLVDTTAAGDVFLGAFSASLSKGGSTKESIRYAQAAAAVCVSRFGAQVSVPSPEDVENFLFKLEKSG